MKQEFDNTQNAGLQGKAPKSDTRPFSFTRCDCSQCTNNAPKFDLERSPVSPTRTPWAVRCWNCSRGELVHFTHHAYMQQLSHANSVWRCPACDGVAEWDDDEYEAGHESEHGDA